MRFAREGLLILVALAIFAGLGYVLVHLFAPDLPDDDLVARQRSADSAMTWETLRANAALTDSLRLLRSQLHDTAAKYAARQRQAQAGAQRLHGRIDSLLQAAQRPIAGPDGEILLVADSTALAASCEERFTLRSAEADSLSEALDACDAKARADSTLAAVVFDSLSTANGRLERALRYADSARVAEIARPRPCRRDWLLAHPKCSVADAVVFTAGAVTGAVIAR